MSVLLVGSWVMLPVLGYLAFRTVRSSLELSRFVDAFRERRAAAIASGTRRDYAEELAELRSQIPLQERAERDARWLRIAGAGWGMLFILHWAMTR